MVSELQTVGVCESLCALCDLVLLWLQCDRKKKINKK